MSRMTCYLFVCTMVLTTVMGMMHLNLRPPQMGVGAQCLSRGNYAGACISQNEYDGELRCLTHMCAVLEADGSYRAEDTGPVDEGTLCGYNKVCENSVCVPKHPTHIAEPLGNEPRYDCYSPPGVEIPPYPSGSSSEQRSPQLVVPAPYLPWQIDSSSSDDSSSLEDSSSSSSERLSPSSSDR